MINKVILVGNVGADPEVRYVSEGVAVARIRLATSESYNNKQGERITNTEWHNLVVWRGLAEVVEKYVKKGMQLYVEGKITYKQYEKDGETKYMTEIVVNDLKMLSKVSEQSSSSTPNIDVPEEGDDLPFQCMKIETADSNFSKYIRLRDTDENGYGKCCSCGKIVHYKDADAGHFINRKHKSVRFSEQNVNLQCRACNRFDEGAIPEYYNFMVKKYGQDVIDKLLIAKLQTIKFGQLEIKTTNDFYKQRVKDLSKLKNFKV